MHRERARRIEDTVGNQQRTPQGQQEGCGLPDHPAGAQQDASQDAGHGARQDHPDDGLPLTGPQRQAALTVRAGYGHDRFFRRADDRRQDHTESGQGARQNRPASGVMLQEDDEESESEQADDDGRDAGQGIREKPDHPHDKPLAGELCQVDSSPDSHRGGDQDSEEREIDSAQQRRVDATRAPHMAGVLQQEGEAELLNTMDQDVPDNQHHDADCDQGSAPDQRLGDPLLRPHADHIALTRLLANISAKLFSIMITRNRMMPVANNAWA